ncbi:hypothetical protein ACP2AV_14085 [Aliiroseovarius sp. PTFE2010]|uniref:hypothetical protein n=1 Tax=Aliiroseovarius sp. PTFE2010 TaxID=3417190 RepID=UPI003CE840AB
MRDHTAPLLIVLATLATAPLMALSGRGDVFDGPALVITPPWRDAGVVVADAGGWLVGPDQALFGAFAQANHPEFSERARQAGAWAVVNSAALAAICGLEGNTDV